MNRVQIEQKIAELENQLLESKSASGADWQVTNRSTTEIMDAISYYKRKLSRPKRPMFTSIDITRNR